jgi:hypothetical protein
MANNTNQLEQKVNNFSERRSSLEHSQRDWAFLTGISAYATVAGAPIYGIGLCNAYWEQLSALGALGLFAAPIAIAAGITYLAKCKTERLDQEVIDLCNSKIGRYNGK